MLIPVILSGGSGTRLWPVSREAAPKPFIPLPDGQSLLEKTLQRVLNMNAKHIFTLTNVEYLFRTRDEYKKNATPNIDFRYILEPFGRNTAPAITIAALTLQAQFGDDVCMLVLPADHLIHDDIAFANAVNAAQHAATQNKIVTFGIQPTTPETGFGYIETTDKATLNTVAPVAAFIEKPSLAKAQDFLASGRYLWNSGMFCFQVGTYLATVAKTSPELLAACQACLKASDTKNPNEITLNAEQFAFAEDISIDYAVMEKADNVAVVPCSIGWSDIGSWNALGNLIAENKDGNRTQGETILINSKNCFVQANDRLVATVGVENLIIVDTPDALLIAHQDHTQDVKKVVGELKAQKHEAYKLHRTAHRPWGTYTILEEGPGFKMKRIVVKPGAQLSLQMHYHRSEHWIVVSGAAIVVNGEQELLLRANESTYIPAGAKHRLANPGVLDLVLIEVQCGDYLGEDDIVRFEDKYGRA